MKHHLELLNRDKAVGKTPIELFGQGFGEAVVLAAAAGKYGKSVKKMLCTMKQRIRRSTMTILNAWSRKSRSRRRSVKENAPVSALLVGASLL